MFNQPRSGNWLGQSTNGRKNTKGIACQHDDVGGLAVDNTRNLSVGNILNRVGATSVLSDADVVIIRNSGNRAVDDILTQGCCNI